MGDLGATMGSRIISLTLLWAFAVGIDAYTAPDIVYKIVDQYELKWNDRKSGAKQVVQIYEAKATSSDTQSVRGFGAVTSYNGKPRSPHLLNEKYFNYHSEK